MIKLGFKLSSEECRPEHLVRYAASAEEHGFTFALISDHYHPWIDRQGKSPFVWSVIGAVSQATERLQLGTAVTCPTVRIHPGIIAQAAATCASLMPGRFFLGVGSGENLNEHIFGDQWPPVPVRHEMLEEAVEIIRLLWKGELTNHRGIHYTVENARIYSLPSELPPILVAVGGPRAAELAGRIGDGYIGTSPKADSIKKFQAAGGKGKPRYGELTVCWAEKEAAARKTAHERWPTAPMPSSLSWELPLPSHFESAAELVTEDAIAKEIVCGPDPEKHLEKIREYEKAGFDHVCIHQVGPDQEGAIRFYEREILPSFTKRRKAA